MKYLKKYTWEEWNRLCKKAYSAEHVGNQIQYFNYHTQRYESYDYLTVAEVLLHRYKVVITEHRTRPRVGKMVKVPLKERLKEGLKNLPSKINQKNFDKGMKIFDEGMKEFSKGMDQFSKELGGSSKNRKSEEAKNKANLAKLGVQGKAKPINIWGSKKSSPKIWSDKTKPKKRRKTKSDKWDRDEENLTKLWGKRR